MVSFVYFQRENRYYLERKFSENINFRVLVVTKPPYPYHLKVSGKTESDRVESDCFLPRFVYNEM